MRRQLFGLAGLMLAASCHAGEAPDAPRAPADAPLGAEKFRAKFPLDEAFANAVLADYRRVQHKLLQKSANGARETVSLLAADGSLHSGYDEFVSTPPKRIREVRDNYVAMQVGATQCVPVAGATRCSKADPVHLGLVTIDKARVARVWSADMPCLPRQVPCRFLRIQTAAAQGDGISGIDPELIGHDYELLFTLSDDVPVNYRQTDRYSVGVTATAFYVFDFERPVGKIELPPGEE